MRALLVVLLLIPAAAVAHVDADRLAFNLDPQSFSTWLMGRFPDPVYSFDRLEQLITDEE